MRVAMSLLSDNRPAVVRPSSRLPGRPAPIHLRPLQEALAAENAVLEKFLTTQQVSLFAASGLCSTLSAGSDSYELEGCFTPCH